MRLQRNSINAEGIEHNNTWYFTIEGNEDQAELIERLESALSVMELPRSWSQEGRERKVWGDFCDGCPVYSDGYSSGYWIPVMLVAHFKAAWKIAKTTK